MYLLQRFITILIILQLITTVQFAQENGRLKVFLDCNNFGHDCHFDYIRQEFPVVNFVRDRLEADVQILLLSQQNNAGSNIINCFFIGYKDFAEKNDTITYSIPTNAMENEFRALELKAIKNGLHYFIKKKDKHVLAEIDYKIDALSHANQPIDDPYNLWVFQMGITGNANGTQNNSDIGINGYFSADRETVKTKNSFFFSYNNNQSKFIDADKNVYRYQFQTLFTNYTFAYKIDEHWAVGVEPGFLNSLYANQKYRYWLDFNVEYSVFPYKQFNTSRLVIATEITPKQIHYYDTTIYLKTQEAFVTNNFHIIYSYTQPWGSINVGGFHNVMLNDLKKYSLTFSGALSLRLYKGLNLALWGNYSKVNNQINIRKGNATIDQLLIRNRELLSAYNYEFNIGFSYRFGSKHNDIINPIFRGLSYNVNL